MSMPLCTIVLAHYRQEQYILNALDSVFLQSYPRLELVVIDDGSENYDEAKINDYIQQKKGPNIERVVLLTNAENRGTVYSMNRAFAQAQGEFIQVFAADDQLTGENVTQNFIHRFDELGDDAMMIAAMVELYDQTLTNAEGAFNSPAMQDELEAMDAEEQFRSCAVRCVFPIGGSCMRKQLFLQYGPFNERYKIVEDWPFFLTILRQGVKVHTAQFSALAHRAGGVSHSICSQTSPYEMAFRSDMLAIMENDVLPYLSRLSLADQQWAYQRYLDDYIAYKVRGGNRPRLSRQKLFSYSPALRNRRIKDWFVRNSGACITNSLKTAYYSLVLLAVCCVLLVSAPHIPAFFSGVAAWANFLLFPLFFVFCGALICTILFVLLWGLIKIKGRNR